MTHHTNASDAWRMQLGLVFQSPHLLMDLAPLENIMLPLLIDGMVYQDAKKCAYELVSALAVEDVLQPCCKALSGGQRQLVAVLRALIRRPKLLFLDEPTSGMDTARAHRLMDFLTTYRQYIGITCIMVSHDTSLLPFATHQWELHQGALSSRSSVKTQASRSEVVL